jgi:chemotaxis protein methyltransferase CheR
MRYTLNESERKVILKLTQELIGSTTLEGKNELMDNRFNKIIRDLDYKVNGKTIIDGLKLGKYKQEFINVFTTNTTRFFREPEQFEYLLNVYEQQGEINVWSAAASSGEEAHTLSIVLSQRQKKKGNSFKILGTDISTKVLDTASKHIYAKSKVQQQTPLWVENYNENWKEVDSHHFKISPSLKTKLSFQQADLLNPSTIAKLPQFDVVFCRNMLIYFNQELQTEILGNIFKKIKVGGFLFLGHSETPWGLENKIEKIEKYHNVFKKIRD